MSYLFWGTVLLVILAVTSLIFSLNTSRGILDGIAAAIGV